MKMEDAGTQKDEAIGNSKIHRYDMSVHMYRYRQTHTVTHAYTCLCIGKWANRHICADSQTIG